MVNSLPPPDHLPVQGNTAVVPLTTSPAAVGSPFAQGQGQASQPQTPHSQPQAQPTQPPLVSGLNAPVAARHDQPTSALSTSTPPPLRKAASSSSPSWQSPPERRSYKHHPVPNPTASIARAHSFSYPTAPAGTASTFQTASRGVSDTRTGVLPSIISTQDKIINNQSTSSASASASASSSSIHHRRKLEPLNLASSSSRSSEDSYTTHRQFSPSTPTFDGSNTGVHRRRLSNPLSPRILRARKASTETAHSSDTHRTPTSPKYHSRPESSAQTSWFPGSFLSLPPQSFKLNKSDDERENDDLSSVKFGTAGRHKKKRHWFGMASTPEHPILHDAPLISMTPPTAADDYELPPPLPVPSGLSPPRHHTYSTSPTSTPFNLPIDPNNILPLSLPPSPMPSPPSSRYATPSHTPHPSLPDLAAEYTYSGSSSSPRTSISTSSSRPGWQAGGRSDSRSSADDEESPVLGHSYHRGQSWFWRTGHSDLPVSPKVVIPPGPTLQPRGMRSKLIPTGTRSWGWLLELVLDTLHINTDDRRGVSRIRRNRERERLMMGKRRSEVAESKWFGRVMAFVPTTPTSMLAFLLFFALLTFSITKTLMYILNPDKQALPWRQYCTANYPSLYSLQNPAYQPSDFDSPFTPSTNLVLAPLTHQHPSWPYRPHSSPPYSAETHSDLSGVEPVGILVGVFTTDAGAERRHMIRQSYASHWRSRTEGTEGVRVRFVMGRPRKQFAKAVQLEMEAFDDILLLDIPENMNSGKTHAFFSWAAENATVPYWEYQDSPSLVNEQLSMDSQALLDAREYRPAPVWRGERPPQYVVKADDDSFIMLGELERRLRVAPRNKAYWGYLVKDLFMGGECYGLSFDLVQYIAESPALRTMTRGKEDKLVSKWMRMHPEKESIVWVAEKCWIYDHPKAGTVYSHGFLYPSEVANIRRENATGISPVTLALRGGPEAADAYSSVSKFGSSFRPIHKDMTATEQVESLVEGSPLSRLREDVYRSKSNSQAQSYSRVDDLGSKVSRMFATRPSRAQRFLDDPEERGGTVVVHYIKKTEWFVETMVALLGTADEQAVWHRGVGNGLGLLERRKGRVVPGKERVETGVYMGKDGGL